MNATCPQCKTVFRIDPRKVPAGGVRARCSVCGGVFEVVTGDDPRREAAAVTASPEAAPAAPTGAAEASSARRDPPAGAGRSPAEPAVAERAVESGRVAPVTSPAAGRPFGQPDPEARARRLARALISDVAAYNPERQESGLREGRLKELFQEELKKSWQEYVEQVGLDLAKSTPYFRDALNEILAKGKRVF